MKKLIAILAAMLMLVLAACGGKKKVAKEPSKFRVEVLEESKSRPEWVDMGDEVTNYKGRKVIMFIGTGESKDQETAKEMAQLNAAGAAATAIKAIATKQVAKAWESIGVGDAEQKEQVMKGLEALSARRVNVAGLLKVSVYWRYVMKPKVVNGKVVGKTQPQYQYYIRYSMDYDTFKQRRDGALTKIKKEVRLNNRQKKLYKDMESKLSELDEADE